MDVNEYYSHILYILVEYIENSKKLIYVMKAPGISGGQTIKRLAAAYMAIQGFMLQTQRENLR